MGPVTRTLEHWWHAMPALPVSRESQSYHTLRRIWGDHTIAGNRGFFNPNAEDHITPSLFHIFSSFTHVKWLNDIFETAGINASSIKQVRFAYSCEEELDDRLRDSHGRSFIIPDIVLHWQDAETTGILAFEVKKPGGVAPDQKDLTKYQSYSNLPGMRNIERRYSCFLVDDRHVARLQEQGAHAIGWSDILRIQLKALEDEPLSDKVRTTFSAHIAGHYARFGVGNAPISPALNLAEIRNNAKNLNLPQKMEALINGLAVTSNWWRDAEISAPYGWLEQEPTASQIRKWKIQRTSDRRLNRWKFDWAPSQERKWPHETGTAP